MHENEQREYFLLQEKAVLAELEEQPSVLFRYLSLNEEWRQRFLDYCIGKKTLPITYNPFFEKVFHPDVHAGYLSQLISSLIQKELKIVKMIPNEETVENNGMFLTTVLAREEDGTVVRVEIQKMLRSSGNVMLGTAKEKDYGYGKKTYTILILEQSSPVFHENKENYIHMGRTVFDSGLKLEVPREYCLVALDVFRKSPYSKERNQQHAWVSFLAAESVKEALAVAKQYPWLVEIYKEMTEYMCDPAEVLNLFWEAQRLESGEVKGDGNRGMKIRTAENAESHPLYVAEIDHQAAGYAGLSSYRDKEAYKTTVELSIYISEKSAYLSMKNLDLPTAEGFGKRE